jgi:hypothetical protein
MGVLALRRVAEALLSASASSSSPSRLHAFTRSYIRHALVPLGTIQCVTSNLCSHYGVLTRWSVPLILEECGWLVYACATSLGAALVLLVTTPSDAATQRIRRLLQVLLFASLCFAAYLAAVDIPMYIAQWRRETAPGSTHTLLILSEGLADSWQCKIVSQKWSEWRGVWLWQTLYFIFGPFSTSMQLQLLRLVDEIQRKAKAKTN